MFSYIWPMALVVVVNTLYQICAKEIPSEISPFASLAVTYLIGASVSLILYFVLNKNGNLLKEYSHINWAVIVLGLVIVGLEVGCIYMYKAGWQVNTALVVENIFVAILLLFVGKFLYNESFTINKAVGVAACLIGLYFLNK